MVREPYSDTVDRRSLIYAARGVAARHLSVVDDDMAQLIEQHEMVSVDIDGDGFLALARAIVDQQISIHAARSIWKRFEDYCGGDVTPEKVLAARIEELRSCGLSQSKARALQDLSRHVTEGLIVFEELDSLPDEEVIKQLIAIRGVGRWTAQMYLIFSLGREDVFAIADGGLRRAVAALKGLPADAAPELIEAIAEDWAPHRTAAALFLWKSLHNS
ncbi:MAG: DNA-3-methyladenine glycosylase 2 family protein [Coriobacteriia bacterium]|nr:DNA-3-methyladenine glycosylase 2 family protein [Coriobacteriia bacterium]MCL2537139.1 DNA-3-methyladenine glycosylase 2 family protein [Coriobacteriia bacterium]